MSIFPASQRIAWRVGALVVTVMAGCAFEAEPLAETSAAVETNGTLLSVEAAFAATPANGVRMGFRSGGFPISGLNSSSRHVQGVARLRSGPHLAVSGSNASDLFIVAMDSRQASPSGRWGSNRPTGGAPPTTDRAIAWLDVGAASGFPSLDHAGGLQAIGDYVVVGLEPMGATPSTLNSAVAIVQVSSVTSPFVARVIDRTGYGTAGAVGITQRLDGSWLMAVGEYDSAKIDFYVGQGASVPTASWWYVSSWARTDAGGLCAAPGQSVSGSGYGAYQNLHLFTQQDGKVYLIGSHRDPWGDDFADLYAVSFFGSVPPCGDNTPSGGWRARLTKVAKKHLICTDACDFDGGGGMYLDGAAQQLIFYGAERNYSTTRGYLRLNEL